MEKINSIEMGGTSPEPEKEEGDKLKVEKLHSAIVQWLADTSEYFLEDIPKSKEEIIEIIQAMSKSYEADSYEADENITIDGANDDVIDDLYALFSEDWERERKARAGFDSDEEWPDPNEWEKDVLIEDSYSDFETWKKPRIKKALENLKEESVERRMPLHEFLNLLKQEMTVELSKIDKIGLTDEQKGYLGVKKSFMGMMRGVQISRGINFGSMPYTDPKIEINENDFTEGKDGLERLEELLNHEFQFTHFDDFLERAEGLGEQVYEKIKDTYSQIKFKPIDLPGIGENWLKIKEYNDKKEKAIKEKLKNSISPYEGKRLRDERDKIRHAKNKEELIQRIAKKREEK